MSKFIHLHTHSHYSLLQALPKIPDLVSKAKEEEMEALALTDAGNLYGVIDFYKECKDENIKPIIGVDFFVATRTRFDKEPKIDNKRTRLILLAKDFKGYQNLIRLVTDSHLEGFYYKPRIDKELITKYSKGLIAISPSFSGDVSLAIKNENKELALEWVEFFKSIFQEDFYIEITSHPEIEGFEERMKHLVAFAKETNVPIVAGHDVYYIHEEDKTARNTLVAVQKTFGERGDDDNSDFSFLSQKEALKRFKHIPEALENTEKIASKCNVEIPLGVWHFPHIDIPEGKTPDEELKRIVYEGFEKRNQEKTQSKIDRVEYELSVIKQKGYAAYFLVVADLLRFAKENGILSNIRGSVSGSLVTFLSGITNIDPLEYDIPFERFLNPDRPSAPDIDMDYADNRRDEMVEYARKKYGNDKVAQIGTFGTMAARGSVRDVTRALGYDVATGDRIAKMVPMGSQGFPMTLDRALEESEELKTAYQNEEDTKRIIDMARKIEGCARHIGVHAAGVVISPMPLVEIVPLQFDPKGEGKIITQFDMYSIDENNAGLLKFDFLGLKNLSIVADTIALVEKLRGIKIDYDNIPLDDTKTFEMLARGETEDTFQLNGDGMTRFLVELKPSTIHDINAMVALYRPGPLQFIPDYIERKHDASKIPAMDPAVYEILKKTYGVLVYQDDLLMMAHKLAGYTWGEVDKFRKAVGKKIPEEMAKQKKLFIEGCVKHSGWSEKRGEEIWAWIEPFAAYGFNKAHSVSYGRVAYITSYLKANFGPEYMSAVLTHESGDVEKVARSVSECKRMGIEVLPPDVNESFSGFTVIKASETEGPKIRFGLTTIKNFGEGIAEAIIEERKKGSFTSVEDFLRRINDRNLNKKSLESLIKVGAFDTLYDRSTLLANLDNMLTFAKEEGKTNKEQTSLFGEILEASKLKLEEAPKQDTKILLSFEKELLGLYISGHPLDKFREKMEKKGVSIRKIKENAKNGQSIFIVGVCEEVKEIRTKKGDAMAFAKIADYEDSIEGVFFPKTYEECKKTISGDKCLAIEGKLSERNGEKSILVDKVKEI